MNNISIYNKMTNAEQKVAEYLKYLGIKWSFEHPVFIWDENKRPRVWAPDFYLDQFGIYIEVCGYKEFNYEYRRKIYSKNGYKVIFLHLYKETYKWKDHFLSCLKIFSNYRTFKLFEIVKKFK